MMQELVGTGRMARLRAWARNFPTVAGCRVDECTESGGDGDPWPTHVQLGSESWQNDRPE